MSFVLRPLPGHLWSGQLDSFPAERLIHGFSTRQGGVSAPPWDALNMALHVGDDPAAVRENRTRYLRALGLSLDNVCTLRQVHGTEIVRALPSDAGRGAFDNTDALADADALITDARGVTLLLCYADCVPVMLYDPKHHAAGLIHAGWKGTVERIAAKTLERMTSVFGTDPFDVLAGIGPSIGAACYEVHGDVAERFSMAFPGHEDMLLREIDGRTHLDLWAANCVQLAEAGVPAAQVDCAETCTACEHTTFYSYRAAGGRTGRMAAVMELI